MRTWKYSLLLLVVYVGAFLIWKVAPSRIVFATIGLTAVSGLAIMHWRAHLGGYFVDRVDFCLHAYVVVDLLLESMAFEGLNLWIKSVSVVQFHDNLNFVWCAAVFSVLVGGYRFVALKRRVSAGRSGEAH